MTIQDDIERWLGENPFSATTVERYRRALTLLAADHPDLGQLDSQDLRAWLAQRGWGASAQWLAYNAVKGFLRWRYGAAHPALTLKLKRPPAAPQRVLRLPQVVKLLESFDTSTPKGKRDLAIAGMMLDCGLRASEVCRLEVGRITYDSDQDAYYLQVIVKGGSWATRSFSANTAAWLEDWLAVRAEVVQRWQKKDHGRLFVGIGGSTPGGPMTRHGLLAVVRNWGKAAGLGALSPHDLRRSMASVATLLGAPEDIAMKGGGWKDADVFRRYTVGVRVGDMKPYFPTTAAMNHAARRN
jgi:integrase